MIYIISGASRSGKTIAAKMLFKKTNIPYINVDQLMMGFAGGMFDTGIHPENWPDKNAELMWPFLKNTIISMIEGGIDYIFEGEEFIPELVNELDILYPNIIRRCFIGFTEISQKDKMDNIRKYAEPNDWLVVHMDDYIKDHINNMIKYSNTIKEKCLEHNTVYFDSSSEFQNTLDEVVQYLCVIKETVSY